jgi:hypothetical protein
MNAKSPTRIAMINSMVDFNTTSVLQVYKMSAIYIIGEDKSGQTKADFNKFNCAEAERDPEQVSS